jgi:hypothetical protein
MLSKITLLARWMGKIVWQHVRDYFLNKKPFEMIQNLNEAFLELARKKGSQ